MTKKGHRAERVLRLFGEHGAFFVLSSVAQWCFSVMNLLAQINNLVAVITVGGLAHLSEIS